MLSKYIPRRHQRARQAQYIPFEFDSEAAGTLYVMKDNIFDNHPAHLPFALKEGMRAYLVLQLEFSLEYEDTDDFFKHICARRLLDAARKRYQYLAKCLASFTPESVILSLQLNRETVTVSPEELWESLNA